MQNLWHQKCRLSGFAQKSSIPAYSKLYRPHCTQYLTEKKKQHSFTHATNACRWDKTNLSPSIHKTMRIYTYTTYYIIISLYYIYRNIFTTYLHLSFWWSTTMMYTSNKKAVMKQPKACRCHSFSMGWLVYLPSWKPIEINVFSWDGKGDLEPNP